MSGQRRKQGRRTIRETSSAAPRPVQAHEPSPTAASYPTALELVSGGEAWRAWLEDALRRVLAPAALAGALGVAAAGCGTGGAALEAFGASPIATTAPSGSQPLSPFGPAVSGKPPAGGTPIASLSPLGPPSGPAPIAPFPVSVVTPEPPARPLPPVVRPPPAPLPPMVRGRIAVVTPRPPAPPPPARPLLPVHEPLNVAGGARPAYFAPPPAPVAPVIVPRPDPPSVDGDMQFVEP